MMDSRSCRKDIYKNVVGVLNINECKIKIWKQASNCSLEEGRKMKKCKLVQNIMNFKFLRKRYEYAMMSAKQDFSHETEKNCDSAKR